MNNPRIDSLMERLSQTPPVWWGIWFGLLLITIGLIALMRTRWGQSKPLRKCVALSLLAHLLIACYATTVQIVHTTLGPPADRAVRVSSLESHEPGMSPAGRTASAGAGAAPGEGAAGPVVEPEAQRQRAASQPAESPSEPAGLPLPVAAAPVDVPAAETAEPADRLVAADEIAAERSRSPEPATALEESPPAPRAETAADGTPEVDVLPRPHSAADALPPPSESGLPGAIGVTPDSQPAAEPEAPVDPAAVLADVNSRFSRAPAPAEPADSEGGATAEASPKLESSSTGGERVATPQSDDEQTAGGSGATSGDAGAAAGTTAAPLLPVPLRQQPGTDQVPEIYRGRVENEDGRHDGATGATAETEQAVESALAWLAANQSPDGRWDAERYGAGTERRERGPTGLPQDRQRAGAKADTGVSGLALLAFLGAGHTHLAGDHQETVRRGLDFLLKSQRADGNLGGEATTYAFMYCHGMAAFALSEAYAMTGDQRLKQPVRRATAYTLAAQNPGTGGWRYRPWQQSPGDPGDMSQLGWQLMALKSASLAGIDVPQAALDRAAVFIRGVSFGTHGGLACYRPGEQASRTMTAEALASRQFLGETGDTPTSREAANYILGELPGTAQANLYYWYYASLALHNLQGESWEKWNAALRRELLATQDRQGYNAGSWPTDSVWAGYGGRVYTAALGALCLEVYYRYLPLYLEASAGGKKVR